MEQGVNPVFINREAQSVQAVDHDLRVLAPKNARESAFTLGVQGCENKGAIGDALGAWDADRRPWRLR
jgi:hypothetical protein